MKKITGPGSASGSGSDIVRGMDPRIRVHTTMLWIRNTASFRREGTGYDYYDIIKKKPPLLVQRSNGTTGGLGYAEVLELSL
jgi:hypothetical protein